VKDGVLKGMYLLKEGGKGKLRVQLMGSGTILREVIAAAELLEKDWGVVSDIWSCPSFTELRREGLDVERWNLLHPTDKPRKSYVESRLESHDGPVVASTDYMKTFAEQIRPFLPKGRDYRVLGTDGFGRSDTREKLRHFFEVNARWVTISALKALADGGALKPAVVADAIKKYGIDPAKPNPATV
jgi:pyruvate dehydrogenase E1 component